MSSTLAVLFVVGMMVLFVAALAVFSALTVSGRASSEEEIDRLKSLVVAQSEEILELSQKLHAFELGHEDESSGPLMLSRKLRSEQLLALAEVRKVKAQVDAIG